ncbi:MAG: ribonuclease III domain-containing protein [Bacillota bacterium]|nr:ribonuclease III domain-containing protein [Bacillota bacterium]
MEVAVNPNELPSLALAYVGDAVYELFVRKHLISTGVVRVNELHRQAVKYVKATTQAKLVFLLEEELSEVELAIVRRGRNAKSGQTPKNTGILEYRQSTGFESLLGYLHLTGQDERLESILGKIPQLVEQTSI